MNVHVLICEKARHRHSIFLCLFKGNREDFSSSLLINDISEVKHAHESIQNAIDISARIKSPAKDNKKNTLAIYYGSKTVHIY